MGPLITPGELGRRVGLTGRQVCKLARDRVIPYTEITRRIVRFTSKQADEASAKIREMGGGKRDGQCVVRLMRCECDCAQQVADFADDVLGLQDVASTDELLSRVGAEIFSMRKEMQMVPRSVSVEAHEVFLVNAAMNRRGSDNAWSRSWSWGWSKSWHGRRSRSHTKSHSGVWVGASDVSRTVSRTGIRSGSRTSAWGRS